MECLLNLMTNGLSIVSIRGGGGRNRNNVTKVIHDDVKFKSIKDYYAFTSYNSPLKHFMPRDT